MVGWCDLGQVALLQARLAQANADREATACELERLRAQVAGLQAEHKENVLKLQRAQSAPRRPSTPRLVDRRSAMWVPDAAATHCDQCHAEFGYLVRKHHCR